MNNTALRHDALKKNLRQLIRHAPSGAFKKSEPLARLVRAFLEYDADAARAQAAESRLLDAMVDYNELRVTPAMEVFVLLGVRYPFAESRSAALRRTLQSIFDRERQMSLECLREMKKAEVRRYFQTLVGIHPYVEAAVALECFDIHAAPVDTKLLLWLVGKKALPEGISLVEAQQVLEKNVRAADMLSLHRGARRQIESFSPRVWPAVATVPSPILAPPEEAPVPPPSPTAVSAAPGHSPSGKKNKAGARRAAPARERLATVKKLSTETVSKSKA